MRSTSLSLAVALLIQVMCVPCLAQESRKFGEGGVSADTLNVGDYVTIKFRLTLLSGPDGDLFTRSVAGNVAEVRERSVVVRTPDGNRTIQYDRIIELTLGRDLPNASEPTESASSAALSHSPEREAPSTQVAPDLSSPRRFNLHPIPLGQITPGDRIRLTQVVGPRSLATYKKRLEGTFTVLATDTLVVQVTSGTILPAYPTQDARRERRKSGDLVKVPLASVTKLEVSRGKKPNTGKGALIGGGLGAIALGVPAYLFGNLFDDRRNTGLGITGAVVGAWIGGGLGAGIGYLIKRERWERVPLNIPRIGFAPDSRGRPRMLALFRF